MNVRHPARRPGRAQDPFHRDSFVATVEGRIAGIGKTIHIKAIHVHYELAVPAEAREATERALAAHPQGCPAHQSVKNAIEITWSAALKAGDQMLSVREENHDPASA